MKQPDFSKMSTQELGEYYKKTGSKAAATEWRKRSTGNATANPGMKTPKPQPSYARYHR